MMVTHFLLLGTVWLGLGSPRQPLLRQRETDPRWKLVSVAVHLDHAQYRDHRDMSSAVGIARSPMDRNGADDILVAQARRFGFRETCRGAGGDGKLCI